MATNFPTSVDVLTNPVSNDSLNNPSHSTQHANANDALEAIEGYILNGTGAEWKAYTPTISNFTLGNGTISFAYAQLGKVIFLKGLVVLGSTSSMGSSPSITLPVTALSASGNPAIGEAMYLDSGVGTFVGNVALTTTNSVLLLVTNTTGTYGVRNGLTSTIPMTWANGDAIGIYGTYEGA